MSSNNFPEFNISTILIHIAFHYNRDRLKYLDEVITTIGTYDFSKVQVVIDTNSNNLDAWMSALNLCKHVSIRMEVHDNLADPLSLTWQHRDNISNQKNNFEYFMYLEDDISVSYAALKHWRQDSKLLSRHNKIRGFIRTELNSDNIMMSTDYPKKVRCKEVLKIAGQVFIKPKNPYQGFWVYEKAQLMKFITSPCWSDGNHSDWGIRERASAGMIWNARKHNLLVPINDYTIPEYVLVKHLPNNYALSDDPNISLLPIDKLLMVNKYQRFCIACKLLLGSIFIMNT